MIKSRWQPTIVAWLIFLAAANCQAQSDQMPTGPKQLTLTAVRAMLFFENTGEFSPDVFTNEVNLWNMPSEAMLVTVEVRAEGTGWYPTGRKVQLTARYRSADVSGYGKPVFFRKTMSINIGSDDKFFAAFWLYETGCHPVTLTARIVGQKRSLQKTIKLGCGE